MSNHPSRDALGRTQIGFCFVLEHLFRGTDHGFDTLVCSSTYAFDWLLFLGVCLMMVVAFLSAATCFATSIGPVSLSVWSTISPVTPNDWRPFNKKRSTNLSCPFFWTDVVVRNGTVASLSPVFMQECVVHVYDWNPCVVLLPSTEVRTFFSSSPDNIRTTICTACDGFRGLVALRPTVLWARTLELL